MLKALPRDSEAFARLIDTRDDAAVVPLGDDLCLVQTVDFFTPIVDSPLWFGRIAAANALSDVYAMGARPLTAMNLVAWPSELGMEALAEVLVGGAEKVAEAGAEPAGGHSIDDKEPKYGLAVTGVARPDEIVYNRGAQVGDALVLTKRLGIGVLASALKNGVITEPEMMPAIEAAAALNAAAASIMQVVGVHACTDVSGFGLLGHLGELLKASGVAAQLEVDEVPLHEGVLELIARQVYAGGLRANRDYFASWVVGRSDAESMALAGAGEVDARLLALFDPQTSGGLLIAVPGERRDALLDGLRGAGAGAWAIGEVVHGPAGRIALR